jgi:hypothetical protein
MGGNVVLEFAARYPEVPSSLVMIDSCIFPPRELLATLQPFTEALQGPNYLAAFQQLLSSMCLQTDERGLQLVSSLQVPQHVLVSALANHLTHYDATSAAVACHVPIAYLRAGNPLVDLTHFQCLTPQLVIARTLGSGTSLRLKFPIKSMR